MVAIKFAPLLAILAVAGLASAASAAPRIHAGVHRTLRQQGTVNLIVTLKEGTESTLNNIKEAEFATRGQKIASLVESLEQHAKTTQAELNAIFAQEASSATPLYTKTESYWISNQANFRTSYGWYDPEKKTANPYDQQGHGTHTMGTIAGSGGIGVAPGATWITCKGCRTDGCSESDLLACAQFITCPTTYTGASKDCTKAPDVVSNSWGGGQGDTFYASAVNAWVAAGIVPVFANGNEGPACKTANSPGDYSNVIAVGATTSTDALASYSSKGPATSGLLKPDVSAPGSSVRSAWYTSTTAYNTISGTSMATPHVTGVIALLLKAKPTLTYAQVKKAITAGVDTTTLASTGYTCGSTADGKFPNNQYGYGRVNAVKVLAASV
uniref:subtilisin n=1 Tax=Globisporangium ultimum (strain ATCC 200006 / CBS 805.95 / DAOM BR144) TaxID=431595 RepID=K3XAI4_GLOUD